MNTSHVIRIAAVVTAALALTLNATRVDAHCDALDGPVAVEARQALAGGEVSPLLKWVGPEDEAELRAAFQRAQTVRSAGGAAAELADTWFLENLVRLHRAFEGAPYTGLKPAGTTEPVVAAADKALDEGAIDALAQRLSTHLVTGVRERFSAAAKAREHASHSVEAGRKYVAAYVEYVHYVKGIHSAIAGGGSDHHPQQAAHGQPAGHSCGDH